MAGHTEAYHTFVARLPNGANPDAAGLFASGAAASGERPLTVSEVTTRIAAALVRGLPQSIQVAGEVSYLDEKGGNWYFRIKDADSVLNCSMWQSAVRRLSFIPHVGQMLLLSGRIEHYLKQGKTQLRVESLSPLGQGELDAQFRRLCAELKALGYFDPARKRPIPGFPKRIAIVTSVSGAAVHDCVQVSGARLGSLPLLLVDVLVQGERAAAQMATAVKDLDRRRDELGIDLILLTRGGGSREDLWAFNERVLADAIAACQIPVAAAIGHDQDISVADLVADATFPTPSAAMERLIPDGSALDDELKHLAVRLSNGLQRNVAYCRQTVAMRGQLLGSAIGNSVGRGRARTSAAAEAIARISPAAMLAGSRERLTGQTRRMATAIRNRTAIGRRDLTAKEANLRAVSPVARLATSRERLTGLAQRMTGAISNRTAMGLRELTAREVHLRAISHLEVLKRGYAILQRGDGSVVSSVHTARAGEQLAAQVADGSIPLEVRGSANSALRAPGGQPLGG